MKKITRGKFSQRFVAYHGCENWSYQDGTNKIVPKGKKCIQQTYNPFWKHPREVRNRGQTRAQLNIKTRANKNFQCRYQKWLNSLTSYECSCSECQTSDWESQSESESEFDTENYLSYTNISLVNNTSETDISSDDKTDKVNTKTELNSTCESLANHITDNSSDNLNKTSETADNK